MTTNQMTKCMDEATASIMELIYGDKISDKYIKENPSKVEHYLEIIIHGVIMDVDFKVTEEVSTGWKNHCDKMVVEARKRWWQI